MRRRTKFYFHAAGAMLSATVLGGVLAAKGMPAATIAVVMLAAVFELGIIYVYRRLWRRKCSV